MPPPPMSAQVGVGPIICPCVRGHTACWADGPDHIAMAYMFTDDWLKNYIEEQDSELGKLEIQKSENSAGTLLARV